MSTTILFLHSLALVRGASLKLGQAFAEMLSINAFGVITNQLLDVLKKFSFFLIAFEIYEFPILDKIPKTGSILYFFPDFEVLASGIYDKDFYWF